MIKAIIYDLDDLMVNSDPLHTETWEIILKESGYKFSELSEKLRSKFIGMRVKDISKEIIKELKLNVDFDYFCKERIRIFLKLVKEKLEAMPGLIYSLNLFKEGGFKVAIASSGAKEYIKLVLERFDISHYFDAIVSGDDVKIGKPSPETYIIACKKLNLKPEECLVLEDATVGIESAKAAGCKCIAIKNPNTLPQDHSKSDLLLSSLEELTFDIVNSL